jgi:hypothetical protein
MIRMTVSLPVCMAVRVRADRNAVAGINAGENCCWPSFSLLTAGGAPYIATCFAVHP